MVPWRAEVNQVPTAEILCANACAAGLQ